MNLSHLTAISPIDGRYRQRVEPLAMYFSEFALFKYRVAVEIEYLIALTDLPLPALADFPRAAYEPLRNIYLQFNTTDADSIKAIEKKINHDVKAVEYFIKEKMQQLGLAKYTEYVHFGLTSQDINNTATPLSIKEALEKEYRPILEQLIDGLKQLAYDWRQIPMLARTHGQPASPTSLGKEIRVYIERLERQYEQLLQVPISAKFGGATGNFNAHKVAFPLVDWVAFSNEFVAKQLGLDRYQHTTQIEHYDNLAALFDNLRRINTILIDFSRDVWAYISMDYFKQRIVAGEVGSSAMPHKVNPIDFENAEGNLGMANAIFEHLSAKLPISRLQRDLTDSTVLRNVGVPFAHTLIALHSLLKGMGKLVVNQQKIQDDLEANWMVVAEAIQTVLRREGYPQPYELLKELTRKNERIDKEAIHQFIDQLNVDEPIKEELKAISPSNYIGYQ
ncbi:MAG: adenylosuccinate lyase [Chitinophagales bacterium]|nr:adenylosuccinate lyase [Chitinophagales bacterium]